MKPTALLLKGFRGLKDGLGRDELELDFSSLPLGTIVLAGENGKGKTTILDNMQPYRIMASKVRKYSPDAFSFYEECYGEDACKDLFWTHQGIHYRSLININASKKKQEAYLFRFDDGGSPEPLNRDGKVGTYDAALEAILGKPELYFISDFRAQNAKYISDYSNGDIKAILAEFLGIDYIRTLSRNARQVATELGKALKDVFEERQKVSDGLAKKEAKEQTLRDWQSRASAIEKSLQNKEAEIAGLQKVLVEICAIETVQDNKIAQKNALSAETARKEEVLSKITRENADRIRAISTKIAAVTAKIASARQLISSVFETRLEIYRLKGKEKEKADLQVIISQAENNLDRVRRELTKIAESERILREKEKIFADYAHKMTVKISVMRSQQDNMQKEANRLLSVPCKGNEFAESCMLVKDAVEAARLLPVKTAELEKTIREAHDRKSSLESEFAPLKEACKDKELLTARETDLTQGLNEARTVLLACERVIEKVRALEKEIAGAVMADRSLPELEQQLAELNAEKATEEKRIAADTGQLKNEIDEIIVKMEGIVIENNVAGQKKEKETQLAALKDGLNSLREEDKAINRSIGALETEVNNYPALEVQREAIEKQIRYLGNEVTEWTIMAKALGDDGIIALEIDDAGPAISKLANDLLKEVYGNRFTIRIDTQDTTAKKLKEEFDVTVIDGRSNSMKSIKKVSGGEKELLEDLIPKAVGLFNKQRHGHGSSTLFTDERDGALDSAKKRAFFLMKNKVLAIGGYEQEFCITHTPELIKMADGVIELSDGSVSLYTN